MDVNQLFYGVRSCQVNFRTNPEEQLERKEAGLHTVEV